MSVRLEQIRKEKGLTRAEVAAKLDISERHLYRLERGTTPVRRVYLLTLADVYGVTVADLERPLGTFSRHVPGEPSEAAA